MLELLTEREKSNLSKWRYSVDDNSISTKILNPFWNKVADLVPNYIAPNVISLAGLFCTLYSFYITYWYSESQPRLTALISSILIFSYQTLDAIDGKHARNIQNASPLGELFDHACDSIGTLFIVLTVSITLGITSNTILYYITQSGMILFMLEHLRAFRTHKVTFSEYTGPGELLIISIAILLWKFITGWSIIPHIISHTIIFNVVIFCIYWFIYVYSLLYIMFEVSLIELIKNRKDITKEHIIKIIYKEDKKEGNNKKEGNKKEKEGNINLLLCLFMRQINGFLLYKGMLFDWCFQDVIAHGFILSVISSDLIVAKMAKRELHPIIVIISMFSIVNHNILIFILVFVYYLKIFNDISDSMKLSIFTPSINVYVDMKNLRKMKDNMKISGFDIRIIVGKSETYDSLTPYIKGVYEIVDIKNEDLINEDFIRKYNISKIVVSKENEEQNNKEQTNEEQKYQVPSHMLIYV